MKFVEMVNVHKVRKFIKEYELCSSMTEAEFARTMAVVGAISSDPSICIPYITQAICRTSYWEVYWSTPNGVATYIYRNCMDRYIFGLSKED